MSKTRTVAHAGTGDAVAQAHGPAVEGHDFPPKRPGRPKWPPGLFAERYREAYAATTPPRTIERVAPNFRRLDGGHGIDPSSLRRLRRQHRT